MALRQLQLPGQGRRRLIRALSAASFRWGLSLGSAQEYTTVTMWGKRYRAVAFGQVTYACGRCGKPMPHDVVLMRRRFELLFLPLVSLRAAFFLTCRKCGSRLRAVGELELQLKRLAGEWRRTPTLPEGS